MTPTRLPLTSSLFGPTSNAHASAQLWTLWTFLSPVAPGKQTSVLSAMLPALLMQRDSFVGTSLALTLLAAGNKVTILDDLSCGQRKNADLLQQKGATFINADILTVEAFPHAQQIYHLACPASPPFYQKDPVRTWKISVIGKLGVVVCCFCCCR